MNLVRIANAIKSKTYSAGVTLITPTGDRHAAFKQAEHYFSKQTWDGPVQWIVVDDGATPTPTSNLSAQQYIKVPSADQLGCCPGDRKAESLTGNVLTALEHVQFDKIIIWEDDDYYSPDYISQQVLRLNRFELVGEGCAHYYNVYERMYRVNRNTKHASFCQTALRASAIHALYTSCLKRTSAFIDGRLWTKALNKFVFQDTRHVIGIKGMPGRTGVGMGHRPKKGAKVRAGFKDDKLLAVLKQWLPTEYVDFYAQFYKA